MDKSRLAQALANLYPDVAATVRIMGAVGVNPERILLEQAPDLRWLAIVQECERAESIPALLAAAKIDHE